MLFRSDLAQMVRLDLGFANALLDHAADLGAPIDDVLEDEIGRASCRERV